MTADGARRASLGAAGLVLVALASLAAAPVAHARPLTANEVPAELAPWIDWVLHDHAEVRCPLRYDSEDARRCAWPGPLHVAISEGGGAFAQDWVVFADSVVPLPGDARRWPQDVRIDGVPVPVSAHDGRPGVRVGPGRYTFTGRIGWERIPETLQVAPDTGLVVLTINEATVPSPEIDAAGALRLRAAEPARAAAAGVRNTVDVQVFRRVVDELPLEMRIHLRLEVAGEAREILLGPALAPGFRVHAIAGPLPARVEADGRLRVQVRPGRWAIDVDASHPEPLTVVERPAASAPWPAEEVWVFDSRPALRLVEVSGAPLVDPRQTSLPEPWHSLPAYRLGPGDALRLEVKRRGDPEPEPDRFALERVLRLDFDGGAYTASDRITGTVTRTWRLEAPPPLELGRVSVDGVAQLVTRRAGAPGGGVELRRGRLELGADSRITGAPGHLSAVGWNHDFQSVSGRLELPPGWRLLAASGVDRVTSTWLSRWTLFDLFLVLIAAAVVGRLWGPGWGVLALVALGLAYHEPDAPRGLWLNALAAVALLRALPAAGRLARAVGWYRDAALLVLLVVWLPFAVDQVRVALYPQLERPWSELPESADAVVMEMAAQRAPATAKLSSEVMGRVAGVAESAVRTLLAPAPPPSSDRGSVADVDPDASIQTGPGVPRWSWTSIALEWSGPVARGQEIRFVLLGPVENRVVRIGAIVLLALLLLRLADFTTRRARAQGAPATGVAGVILAAGLLAGPADDARAEFPPEVLLEQLGERLRAPPECAPECASISRMYVEAQPSRLRLHLEVHAQAEVGIPLPGGLGQWQPAGVLVDGEPPEGLYRDDAGRLWVHVPPGLRDIVLEGPLPERDRIHLALPLRPMRVDFDASGWSVEGVHEDGVAGAALQLTRVAATPAEVVPALAPGFLPPLLRVERTLSLGLEWRVHTRVVRLSPPGDPILVEVPVIEGESVTSGEVRVRNGRVLVGIGAGESAFAWSSVLAIAPEIALVAPDTGEWTELWQLDASPIWHVEHAGLDVVHRQSDGRWLPQWRPWPGESVRLAITRPDAVPGRTLTIDSARLSVRPGQRATEAELEMALRSSRGGQHSLTLPEGVTLLSVVVDGQVQPIRQQGRTVRLPIAPGERQVTLAWRSEAGLTAHLETPLVDLGAPAVNASIRVDVPPDRWVLLTGGPRQGPAVLYWGLLAVLVAVAFGLGRVPRTPLRSRHWLLLAIGLSQIEPWLAVVVVGWLFALDARGRARGDVDPRLFNLGQVALVVLSAAALALLLHAVQQGLLGAPDMQIAGNGSSGGALRWYADRVESTLPVATVWSVPLLAYRLLMLAWALWLAFALVGWLRWGWRCFATDGYWRTMTLLRPRRARPDIPIDEPEPLAPHAGERSAD